MQAFDPRTFLRATFDAAVKAADPLHGIRAAPARQAEGTNDRRRRR
jgi:hypothetical protein